MRRLYKLLPAIFIAFTVAAVSLLVLNPAPVEAKGGKLHDWYWKDSMGHSGVFTDRTRPQVRVLCGFPVIDGFPITAIGIYPDGRNICHHIK